jgi:putative tryptophan/tyrosine transport system substrate-binding protein
MAVKRHAPAMPVLFISVGNPLGIGLVESLSRPGGNVTGFGDFRAELSPKYVQFAAELGKPHAVIHTSGIATGPTATTGFGGPRRPLTHSA